MTWDNGPWAIDGGATSADVGRLLAWHAVNGLTGVGNPTDLRVRALNTPGTSVLVGPGTCSVPTKALGKSFQVYLGSNPTDDSIDIPSTSSGAGRSDLIVARVENPITGEPWVAPDDPLAGQYIFTRRYPGVASNTTDVAQVDPSASAVTLARIDIPPSTGTITNAMIVDLRKALAPPLADAATFTDVINCTSNSVLPPPPTGPANPEMSAWIQWPTEAQWTVKVPSWATVATLYFTIDPGLDGNTWGELRFNINNGALFSTSNGFDVNFPTSTIGGPGLPFTNGGGMRVQYHVGGKIDVPASMRGTSVPIKIEGRTFDASVAAGYGARGSATADRGAVVYLQIAFKQGATAS